ncbi:MAG TPA: mercuric transporter MerT family protein [Candidatus Limnocylindria bacterium]|nr:mercuric transporter MerT family protein [Candidatus Limnocylindria bacterium]
MSTTVGHASRDDGCRDWVRDRRVSWVWPAAFVAVGVGWLLVPGTAGSLLAAGGFAVAGALCVGNALRCRRVHCVITGPLYLLAAALFLARGGGRDVPEGWVVAGAIVGTAAAFVPEWLGRGYVEAGSQSVRARTAMVGVLAAAGLVGACCLGPTLFVIFGVSVASLGTLGALEPYRGLFLLAGIACWFLAYRERRRATAACADETCGTPASRRLSGVLLWGSLAALVAAAIYPYVVALVV